MGVKAIGEVCMRQLSNDELVELWHPDFDSDGYAHENIAYELSRRLKPKGPGELLKLLYPSIKKADEIPLDERILVDRGYLKWKDPNRYASNYWTPEGK
jgi:hypothetical protein